MKNYLVIVAFISFLSCDENEGVIQIFEGDLELRSQEDIDSIAKFSYRQINGDLHINYRDFDKTSINSLNGLKTLEYVSGDFYITQNPSLETLEGLEELDSVGTVLFIARNEKLISLNGLNSLKSVSIQDDNLTTGGFFLVQNNLLTNLNGLEGLRYVEGDLWIESNKSLIDLRGLNNIEYVTGLVIEDDSSLVSLNGLNNLVEIGYESLSTTMTHELGIRYNPKLTSIDGLQNLIRLNGYMNIEQNLSLTDFCGISNVFTNKETITEININNNYYNPTTEDFESGNCQQ